MEWQGNRMSENVEYRRSGSGRKMVFGGIGTIFIAIIMYFLGMDPTQVLNFGGQQSDMTSSPSEAGKLSQTDSFVSIIHANTEDVWTSEFAKMGKHYQPPVLVNFSGETTSDCGGASASSGPFYCPADKKVYLDHAFFVELQERYGVEGNFAPAYVIAHEVGHYIQDVLGIAGQVQQMQQRVGKSEANRLSVMLELQADFLAGYWARRAQNFKLTEQDIRSALTAANAIGDDKLQLQSQGHIVPDAFTHGTSEQRMEWFMRGFKASNIEEGNTFKHYSNN
ncbi:MAG: neutral zinc metallopeptidase [Chitinophagales bacterium]